MCYGMIYVRMMYKNHHDYKVTPVHFGGKTLKLHNICKKTLTLWNAMSARLHEKCYKIISFNICDLVYTHSI